MRFSLPIAILPAALVLLAGCGGEDGQTAGTGRLFEGLARESATLAERTVTPVERAGADSVAPPSRERDRGEAAAGSPDRETVPPGERGPELAYTRRYYAYRPAGHRDPFEPLLSEGGEVDGLSLSALTLTGILWDADESLIVLEDSRGRGYPLRVGDRLAGARLVAVREDAAVFRVVEFGEAHSVVKELFVAEERPI